MSQLSISCLAVAFALFYFQNANAKVFINISGDVGDGVKTSNVSGMHYQDDMETFTNHLETLKTENRALRMQLDGLNKKLETGLSELRQQMSEIMTRLRQGSHVTTGSGAIAGGNLNLPKTCAEAMTSNNDPFSSAVYALHLPDLDPFEVLCVKDLDNGPAWTVIQKRQDGSIDFYRTWFDYKYGFGNVYGEYWLGLERIHALTKDNAQELWISLEDFDGEVRHVKYDAFKVGDAKSAYTLESLGNFSGNAGDSMDHSLKSKFSTKDADNDGDSSNCAIVYFGAWWFKQCANAHLNAKYTSNQSEELVKSGGGILWYTWRGHYSLKKVHMAVRPKQ